MNSNDQPQSFNSNAFRSVLFSVAKFLWGIGILLSYTAILIVPFSSLCEWTEWLGPFTAALIGILSKLLLRSAEGYRRDAEELLRADELLRGIGHPIDRGRVATIKARYSAILRRFANKRSSEVSYYEAEGPPSLSLLVKQLRESSWWTEQLAAKVKTWIITFTWIILLSAIALVIFSSTTISSLFVKMYSLAVCLLISIDLLNLVFQYANLKAGAQVAFNEFNLLSKKPNPDANSTLITVLNYQFLRSTAPPIFTSLKLLYSKRLQTAWDEDLSMHSFTDC